MAYNYEDAKAYIFDIPRFSGKNDPEVTKEFLEFIGDISKQIPVIHVAGTNGKRSVCAYLCAILKCAGYKAGMFTSPHLESVRERFSLDGEMISRDEFAECFNDINDFLLDFKEKNNHADYHPSFFEFLFFMSVIWYQRKKPDVLILETGLGGRLDATNSVSAPKLCIITEIGMDHMEYLGDTVEKIAFEKAGIIKNGVPIVYADKPVSGDVIEKTALERGCEAVSVSNKNYDIINYGSTGIDFSLKTLYHGNASLSVGGFASYQVWNASIAYTALEVFSRKCPQFSILQDAYEHGIKSMYWPGRMERLSDNFIIDGAHNEDGINAFLDSVSRIESDKRYLLYSAVSDKQIEIIASLIIKSMLFDRIFIAGLESSRAADTDRLKACFGDLGERVSFATNVQSALDAMLSEADNNTMCYAAGSLYLVGEIKRIFK